LLRALPYRQNHSVREPSRKKRTVEWALVWAVLYFCAPLGQLGTDLAHDLHHRLSHESSDHGHVHPASFPSHAPASHHAAPHTSAADASHDAAPHTSAADASHDAAPPTPATGASHSAASRASQERDRSGVHGHGTTIDLLLVLFEHVGAAPNPIPDRDPNQKWDHVIPCLAATLRFGWSEAFADRSIPLIPPMAESIEHPPRARV
jgi:hypothetical protein